MFGSMNFLHRMNFQRSNHVLNEETQQLIIKYFNETARECPNKKETVLVNGTKVAIKYLESTLTVYYNKFKEKYPELKISQRSFEKVRPKKHQTEKMF